ncbi:hypothetical protein EXE46_15635 [Halorubrum sp. GN11_10-6_MGM]|uniref:phage/plasmid primase, P4 family n=1 Tax=Halorubrum sp. GN11_10-6_MGM TaxID=2518112 RepID=UPI0010FA0324|nr:phage/plasmid primase, P4 family [Halorubrum sp. GN11_10-6_MGM]TKX72614.1 hypothetical protein EXE46_15635 [Halorubrum sp. GN11_10-6_MGM]
MTRVSNDDERDASSEQMNIGDFEEQLVTDGGEPIDDTDSEEARARVRRLGDGSNGKDHYDRVSADGDDADRELVTDGGREPHEVIYCNYCEGGMSVPLGDIPDDPMCRSCKRARKPKPSPSEVSREFDEASVSEGDRVLYDGDEYLFAAKGPWTYAHLTKIGHAPDCVTKSGPNTTIDKLSPVDDPDALRERYEDYEPADTNDGKELVTDGGEPVVPDDNEAVDTDEVHSNFEEADVSGSEHPSTSDDDNTHNRDGEDGEDSDDGDVVNDGRPADDADDADDDGDWDVGGMDLSFPPESDDDTHDRVEYAEHPPADLPGAGDDSPAATDVDLSIDKGVDPDDVSTPRPVVRTVKARSLSYDKTPDTVRYRVFDGCGDDECDVGDSDGVGRDELDYRHDVAPRKRAVDASDLMSQDDIDEFNESLDDKSDGDTEGVEITRTTLYGVVVKRISETGEFGNMTGLMVRIADETGVIDCEINPNMPQLDEFEQNDEIVVTNVERASDDSATMTTTADSQVVNVGEGVFDTVTRGLEEETQLARSDEIFQESSNKTEASSRIADIICDEWTVELPRGSDKLMMYIDDEDAADYGLFKPGETYLEEIIDDNLPATECGPQRISIILSMVKHRSYVEEDAFWTGAPDVVARKKSVACENGVIDLRTGELHEHGPEWRATEKIPIEYHPEDYDGLGEGLDWFIDDVTEDAADRETLLYSVAHMLHRSYPVEAIFMLIGPGANGKTVWNTVLQRLIGSDNTGQISMRQLTDPDESFGTKPLLNNHLAVDDDATDVSATSMELMKKHSGSREGSINIKNEKVDGYLNYATMVLLSNDPPVLMDDSDGATRRMFPVVMPHKYTNDPNDEHKNRIDRDEVLNEIASKDELRGLLVEAVDYAQRMHRDGSMEVGRSEEDREEIYESYSDAMVRFWEECSAPEEGARVPKSVIYEIYVNWCERNNKTPKSPGGSNGFWPLSKRSHARSFKTGAWMGDERAIEHVTLSEKALEYAPEWVLTDWGDDITATESPASREHEKIRKIADLSGGHRSTIGKVIDTNDHRTQSGHAVKITIEDNTDMIEVTDYIDGTEHESVFDGVSEGDQVKILRGSVKQQYGKPEMTITGATEVRVAPRGEFDFEEMDDLQSGTERLSVTEVVIDALDDGEGASKKAVMDRLTGRFGLDPRTAVDKIKSLLATRRAVDPGDGRLRLISDSRVVYESLDTERDSGRTSQHDRVSTVKSVIERVDDGDGASELSVIGELAGEHGMAPETAEDQIASMKSSGKLEAPADGKLRLVNPKEGA